MYTRVPVEQCWERAGKAPIGTRWVDVSKGDEKYPDYRSRLVAQETNDKKREDLFAATPPLEAKKFLFSLAVTEGWSGKQGVQKIEFIDIKRAFFHAEARRDVYVELPEED